jgi:hypothetical protein
MTTTALTDVADDVLFEIFRACKNDALFRVNRKIRSALARRTTSVKIRDPRANDSDLDRCCRTFADLVELDVAGTSVADVSPIRGLRRLETLRCDDTDVTDLSPLADVGDRLVALSFSWTRVSDMTPLRGLSRLRSLDCFYTRVGDLSHLSALVGLRELKCSWNHRITDVSPLRGLVELRTLDCSFCLNVVDRSSLDGLVRSGRLEIIF